MHYLVSGMEAGGCCMAVLTPVALATHGPLNAYTIAHTSMQCFHLHLASCMRHTPCTCHDTCRPHAAGAWRLAPRRRRGRQRRRSLRRRQRQERWRWRWRPRPRSPALHWRRCTAVGGRGAGGGLRGAAAAAGGAADGAVPGAYGGMEGRRLACNTGRGARCALDAVIRGRTRAGYG